MKPEVSIQNGKNFLKEKEYKSAIREFKKAIKLEQNNPEAHHLLSRAYLKLGLNEKEPTFIRLAEDSVRYSIKIDPFESVYHDSLIEISSKLGKLDGLSTEYHKKMDERENPEFYKEQLKKISTISVLSIPEGEEKEGGYKKGRVFLNYVVLPVIAAALVSVFLIQKLRPLRIPAAVILVGFVAFKIIYRPKSKVDSNKW